MEHLPSQTTPLPADICELLYHLGITPNYISFFYIAHALSLIRQDPQQLRFVTKRLYPDVAKHYETTVSAVEWGIRRAISHIWDMYPSQLTQLSAAPLSRKPTNSCFLALLHHTLSPSISS